MSIEWVITLLGVLFSGGLIAYKLLTRKDRTEFEFATIDPLSAPFTLILNEELAEDLPCVREGLIVAISFMNESIGARLFVDLGDSGSGSIIAVIGYSAYSSDSDPRVVGQHKDALAWTKFNEAGLSKAVYVNVDRVPELDDEEIKFALAHELGHVLGLAHDDFTRSLMYRQLQADNPELTPRDQEFIRHAYRVGEK